MHGIGEYDMQEIIEKIIFELRKLQNKYECDYSSKKKNGYIDYYLDGKSDGIIDAVEIVNQVAEEYGEESGMDYSEFSMENQVELFKAGIKPKYVSIGAYKQVAWERDIAIEQLHELGYELGQKIDGKEVNVSTNDGWIPCSSGNMPEEHDSIFAKLKGTDRWSDSMFGKTSDIVNVTVMNENGERTVTQATTSDGNWKCDLLRWNKSFRIVAWQPLPEPYQPKGE